MLLLQLITEAGELIDPGLDAEHVTTLRPDAKHTLPTVIAHILHGLALPGLLPFGTPAHLHRQLVVPVGEHLAGDHHFLPHHRLDGKLATLKGRHGVLNRNPRQQQSLGQRDMGVVVQLRRCFASHRASLLYAPWTLCCGLACASWRLCANASAPEMNSLRFRATGPDKSSGQLRWNQFPCPVVNQLKHDLRHVPPEA
ncbi:hypothetical protein D3C73_692960 [compost metagenome]